MPQTRVRAGPVRPGNERDPHSSASKCENPTWRRRSTGRTAATLPDEREHPAGPVWKSSGSSSTTRYWLKLKPPGTRSTGVLIR